MTPTQDELKLEADLLIAALGGAQSAVELEALASDVMSVPHTVEHGARVARAIAAELRRRALVKRNSAL